MDNLDSHSEEPIKPMVQFSHELDLLVRRCRMEYDLTYSEIVGALQMHSHYLMQEAYESTNDED